LCGRGWRFTFFLLAYPSDDLVVVLSRAAPDDPQCVILAFVLQVVFSFYVFGQAGSDLPFFVLPELVHESDQNRIGYLSGLSGQPEKLEGFLKQLLNVSIGKVFLKVL
jgi:hypothetical protein